MDTVLTDTSRWTILGSRWDTPQILIDEFRQMFRDCLGDEIADAAEATIPPPYGTLETPHFPDTAWIKTRQPNARYL